MNRILMTFVLSLPLTSYAGPTDYVCIIKQELFVTADGKLTPHKKSIEIGNTFAIDRETGKILGRPFSNSTAREVKIITQGDKTHNFEVLSASSPFARVTTDLVVVHEWMKTPEKKFIGLSSEGTVYSGTCK